MVGIEELAYMIEGPGNPVGLCLDSPEKLAIGYGRNGSQQQASTIPRLYVLEKDQNNIIHTMQGFKSMSLL